MLNLYFESILGLFFLILIIFPIKLPLFIISFIYSIYGIILILIILFLLFIYTNPILGILFIIFLYINYQRTILIISNSNIQNNNNIQPQSQIKSSLIQNNNENETLEEYIINKIAPTTPIDKPIIYLHSKYKPLNEDIGTASVL